MSPKPAPNRGELLRATQRTRQFTLYFVLGIAALFAAITTRNPAMIALGAPFLIAIAGSLAVFKPLDAHASMRLSADRVVEGETVMLLVDVSTTLGIPRVTVEVTPSEILEPVGRLRITTSVAPGSTETVAFTFVAEEWGVTGVKEVRVRIADRFGLFAKTIVLKNHLEVRVGLPHDRRRAALSASRFRRIAGSHTSSDRGEGTELADVRPYQPGDALKNINWRITHRRKEPWVNLRHPDRSTTVILVVDAHAKVHRSLEEIQRHSVAAALSLVQAHLDLHDRVGLLVVGHTTKWLAPGVGRRQLFRISDALVAVGNTPDASLRLYRPHTLSHIPSNAIVIAVSPLLDPLMVRLIAQLRSGGKPVAVLRPTAAIGRSRMPQRERYGTQARELARLEQAIGVESLRKRGVTIAEWEPGEPLDAALNAITTMQRMPGQGSAGRAHVR